MDAGDSTFWNFSLRLYRRPHVPELCLALQDEHGVDVNILFFILFLAIHQRRLDAEEVRHVDAFISAWRQRVVQPLRTLRRDLKGGLGPVDTTAAEALRSAIKRDELLAERLQQQTLEQQFPAASTGTPATPRDAAAGNIEAYGALTGALPQAKVRALLSALQEEFSV